jgi:predicted alpha/beta hydrolase family esterase
MTKILNLFLFLILFSYSKVESQTIDTLVNVGNHQLHFNIIKGKGIPILFESGNGDDGTVWEKLLKPLYDSIEATLITYDRAGLGQSEIDTVNINFKREIEDLESGLSKLGYSKDIFIVSHSFGGFYSTLFANRNNKQVKGAVYIDVALPCFCTKEWSKKFVNSISDKDWVMIKKYKIGLYYVLKNLESISGYMSNKPLSEKIPITLIVAEKILPMVKENEVDKWKECFKSFGSLPNHKYVLAKESEHKVWEDNAQLVVNEIIKLYKEVNYIKK